MNESSRELMALLAGVVFGVLMGIGAAIILEMAFDWMGDMARSIRAIVRRFTDGTRK